ncbi:MAG: hypothetical protein R3D84_15615 [Paracoccaceae bacterium]
MKVESLHDYRQMPGLFRLWDLQQVLNRYDEFQVHYAGQTDDGIALFAVYRCEPVDGSRDGNRG